VERAARLMLRDVCFPDDNTFFTWHLTRRCGCCLTAEPMLMHVLSPSLVLLGAQRRWNAFRKAPTSRRR